MNKLAALGMIGVAGVLGYLLEPVVTSSLIPRSVQTSGMTVGDAEAAKVPAERRSESVSAQPARPTVDPMAEEDPLATDDSVDVPGRMEEPEPSAMPNELADAEDAPMEPDPMSAPEPEGNPEPQVARQSPMPEPVEPVEPVEPMPEPVEPIEEAAEPAESDAGDIATTSGGEGDELGDGGGSAQGERSGSLEPPRIVELMKRSLQQNPLEEFGYDQVVEWRAMEPLVFEGQNYQTGEVVYLDDTILGKGRVRARALIRDGEVERWIWTVSGFVIK